MRGAWRVEDVRAAEAALMNQVPAGALMARAAAGLARTAAALLDDRGGARGADVMLLVGSGNNGGDTLWAGARLARRGARVLAALLADEVHAEGLAALRAAGGRTAAAGHEVPRDLLARVRGADLVLDGIVGIGGRGPLRPAAAALARAALAGGAVRVAVDVPSGIDPDTGAVPDPDAVFVAHVTVTFGAPKAGLLVMPAAEVVGVLDVVDIGLDPFLAGPAVEVLGVADVALLVPPPGPTDHKYSRGVVGVAAGSSRYRGAALLCTGGARRAPVGKVDLLGRDESLTASVLTAFPDVVAAGSPGQDARIGAWAVGPGLGQDEAAAGVVAAALATEGPVLLDADALSLLAADPALREAVARRASAGATTVVTPHDGEFARLGYATGSGADEDRVGAARRAAADLGSVVLLKGARTVVAEPGGRAWVNLMTSSVLATAGSGDVLSGLVGGLLAHAAAGGPVDAATAARAAAAGAWLHGLAARVASEGGRPVAAWDIVGALPAAMARARGGQP